MHFSEAPAWERMPTQEHKGKGETNIETRNTTRALCENERALATEPKRRVTAMEAIPCATCTTYNPGYSAKRERRPVNTHEPSARGTGIYENSLFHGQVNPNDRDSVLEVMITLGLGWNGEKKDDVPNIKLRGQTFSLYVRLQKVTSHGRDSFSTR